jgi:UDP-N-acetylmuramate--alanine ligase
MTHVHLIGIGGSGISSIARVLLEKGYKVSGSDRALSSLALDLRSAGATVFEGHTAQNITGADLVVRSSAIADDNVEVVAALKIGIPVLKRSDFLGSLMKEAVGIAVAGSHGKTTTSAMMAWALKSLGTDPSYILGGVSNNLQNNAHAGTGKYFVIEADEYDRMFLGLQPEVILLTNIGYDHPDCFPTVSEYEEVFRQFVAQLKPGGIITANYADATRLHLFESAPLVHVGLTYGLDSQANYYATNLHVNEKGCFTSDVVFKNKVSTTLVMAVPGEHNVLNALGVYAVLHQMGLAQDKIADALSHFTGTGRRFEVIGEVNGITVIDDYAHHPAKIQATLAAARVRYPGRRIVAIWQPHTYSRTRALAAEFAESFENADLVIISEIFASREKPENYSASQIAQAVNYTRCLFIPDLGNISAFLATEIRPGDVVIVLSAGDANQICTDVINDLKKRSN